MRILIAEDDQTSRRFLYKFLSNYGECDLTVDGIEAVDAFMLSIDENRVYDLICLDIMMPKLDGLKALKVIRDIERKRKHEIDRKVRIIMLTAISERATVSENFTQRFEAYIEKPIDTNKLKDKMIELGLL